jgi:hypothetical protein
MGLSVVVVPAGGLPVIVSTNGYGLPCTISTNGYGVPVTQSTNGSGLAVIGVSFGPTIQLSAASVLETAAVNTVVGTLSVSPGTTGSPVFALVDSAGGKFNISGTSLRTNALLDYETATSHTVIVSVSGVTPTVANATFIISVGDVVEPVIQLTGTSVNENATAGTNIGVLSIANSFTGSPVYTLVDSASGKVAISGSNLNVLGAIDYETTPTFNITVSVSGITPAAVNKTFTIVVLDVVESASATWNPSDKGSTVTLSGGNLTVTSNTGAFAYDGARATASASTGKYYSEHAIIEDNGFNTFMGVGIVAASRTFLDGINGGGTGHSIGVTGDGNVFDFTQSPAIAGPFQTFVEGNTVCMAIDLDNRKFWYRTCIGATVGNWNNSGTANPATNVGGVTINALTNGTTFFPLMQHLVYSAGVQQISTTNFGATSYAYTPPAGFSNWGGGGALGATKNIVTDYGAVGDAQWARTTLSITTNVLTSATPIWSSGDVGKTIVVGFAGSHSAEPGGGSVLISTITAFNSSTSVTLANNASWPLSSEPNVIVAWGTNNGKSLADGGVNGPFETFRLAYQGQAVTLTIPAGNYLIASGNFGPLFNGIKNITVNATGATICGGAFALGSFGQSQFYGHSAYTANVSAGATSVTLSTPAYVSRFTIGQYALMTGFGLQYGGYPSNHQRFEYVFITAIDSDTLSPTYGKITFLSPLVNSYFSTWPLYLDETGTTPPPENGQYTSGGPATLYAFDAKFDHTAVLNNLTIAHHPQMGMTGLNLTLNGCTFESIWGPHVTMCKAVTLNTCLGILCTMEVDKLITAFTMNGCDWGGLSFQSASVTAFIADDTDIRYSITGTPYKCTIRNGSTVGTISGIGILTPSATYGYCNELVVTSSQVKNFGAVTTHESGHVIIGGTSSSVGVNTEFTKSGGVITIPLSYKAYGWIEQWPVIGAKMFFYDVNVGTIGSFSITNVTYDSTNVYVTTTASGGWPTRSYNPSFGLRLIVHPAPICTFTSVTGCPEVVDLSNAGAAGLPLYSYSKRTYSGLIGASEYWQVWGRVKKIVVIVTTPSAAAASVSIDLQASNILIKMSDFSNTTWHPIIDLNKTGTRTFDATANTYPVSSWSSTAVAAADTLPGQTEALWVPGNYRVVTSGTAAAAVFSVEVITDQG